MYPRNQKGSFGNKTAIGKSWHSSSMLRRGGCNSKSRNNKHGKPQLHSFCLWCSSLKNCWKVDLCFMMEVWSSQRSSKKKNCRNWSCLFISMSNQYKQWKAFWRSCSSCCWNDGCWIPWWCCNNVIYLWLTWATSCRRFLCQAHIPKFEIRTVKQWFEHWWCCMCTPLFYTEAPKTAGWLSTWLDSLCAFWTIIWWYVIQNLNSDPSVTINLSFSFLFWSLL